MSGAHQNNQLPITTSTGFFPDEGLDIRSVATQLYQHIWFILGTSIITFLIAFLYTFTVQPQYQSTALIQINTSSSNSNLLSKFGYKSSTESDSEAQLAVIKTRYILEPVIKNIGLNIIVKTNYFPIVGAWIARRYQGDNVASPLLGLKKYAWGGEAIEVKNFSVPSKYLGQIFRLVAEKENTFTLYSSNGRPVLSGKAGQLISQDNGFQLELSSFHARPETEFYLQIQSPLSMLNGLVRNLKISPIFGNDPMQSTGISQLQLSDTDPNRVVRALNGIISYTIEKNIQEKSQETQKTLEFLSQRLPELKAKLSQSEDLINQYHSQNNTLSMSMKSQSLAKQLMTVEQNLEKLRSEKEDLSQIYTDQHPIILAMVHKEAELQKQLAELKSQIRQFPTANQQEINLYRDAKIKNAMYMSLLNSEAQLELAKAGLLPTITALTDATPPSSVPTHKLLTMIMGFLMGAFLSSIAIILKSAFNRTIAASDQLENEIEIPILSIVPYSQGQKRIEKLSQKTLHTLRTPLSTSKILAKQDPDDIAVESLRSLRMSLQIMSYSQNHQVIAIMGTLSGIGKSFVSLNLAQIIADTGKKTLLIDADIRRGSLHVKFDRIQNPGLSEYLEGKCELQQIIHPISNNFFFIPRGTYKAHPIELFENPRYHQFLEALKQDFAQIIIDTPPVLAVSDAILIAQKCDTKLFVVTAGRDTIRDIKQAIRKSHAHGIEINGIVFNHLKTISSYGSSASYQYAYETT